MTSADFKFSFHSNSGRNARERIGNVLRMLCDRLDGRVTVAISIETTPVLTPRQHAECILFGLSHMRDAVRETTKTEAYEIILDDLMKVQRGVSE